MTAKAPQGRHELVELAAAHLFGQGIPALPEDGRNAAKQAVDTIITERINAHLDGPLDHFWRHMPTREATMLYTSVYRRALTLRNLARRPKGTKRP